MADPLAEEDPKQNLQRSEKKKKEKVERSSYRLK
jgi:hypothetical protein